MAKTDVKLNFLLNAAYQLLKIAVPLLTVPYLSRVLGANGVGDYSFTYSIADYFVLAGLLGLNQYGNRAIARVREDEDSRSRTFWSIFAMQFVWSIAVAAAYLVWAAVGSGEYRVLAMIWSVWVISDALDVNWFFFGMEEFKITVTRNALLKLLSLVLIFLLVKEQTDVYMYCGITALNFILSAVVLWPFLLKRVKWYKPTVHEVLVHIKPNCLLFAPVVAISLYTQMDKIILGLLSSSEQVGLYDFSEKLSKIPLALITALGTVMLPRMSNVAAKGNKAQLNRYVNLSFYLAVSMAMCFCFGISSISPEFVPVFFGDGWNDCKVLMPILSVIIPCIAITNVLGVQYLIPTGKDKLYTASVFAGAAVNILMNLLLVPRYRAVGSAIATVVAELSVLIVQLWILRKEINYRKWMIPAVCSAACGLVMLAVVRAVAAVLGSATIISLVVEVIIGGAIYVVLALAWMKATSNPLLDSIASLGRRKRRRRGTNEKD